MAALTGNGLKLERDSVHVQLLGVQERSAGEERRGGRVRGTGGESVGHLNLPCRGREGRPSQRWVARSGPQRSVDAAGVPGSCTRRASAGGRLRAGAAGAETYPHPNPLPFRERGGSNALQLLVHVHVAVNVPVPVRRRSFASSRATVSD